MSTFEFSQNLSIGQYLPLDSWIHQREARAKIIAFFGLILAITFTRSTIAVLAAMILVFVLFPIARVPIPFALKSLRTPLPFLVFIAFLQIFRFSPGVNNPLLLEIWSLTITTQGLVAAGTVISRFVTLILLISLTSFTLSTSDLIYGLQSLLTPLRWIGIQSDDFIMIVQITLHYLPMLGQSTEQIAKAQAARGALWGIKKQNLLDRIKTIYPVIIPMFIISLQRAENMALAMDARGFGSQKNRGSYQEFHFNKKDGIFLAAALIIIALIVFL
jgi:energy-coupling factor transport system permease protein